MAVTGAKAAALRKETIMHRLLEDVAELLLNTFIDEHGYDETISFLSNHGYNNDDLSYLGFDMDIVDELTGNNYTEREEEDI